MNNKLWLTIFVVWATIALVACGGGETATTEAPPATQAPPATTVPTQEATSEPQPATEVTAVTIQEVQDIVWQWSGLIESEPAAQSVVPNPEDYTLTLREDNTFNFKADCNVGSGSYTVDGSSLSLLMGPVTLAECGPDSLYNQYLASLGSVVSFGMRDDILVLGLQNQAGEMQFANGGPAEEIEPVPCEAGIDPSTVTLDTQDLPYSYQPNCVPATPYDASQPPTPVGLPDHIEVNFGAESPQDVQSGDPIIYIIPVAEYEEMWDEAGNQSVSNSIETLQTLLTENPEPVPTSGIPILPYEQVRGVSDLQVQGLYLDITMGTGVRFVTRFAQDPNPVSSDNPPLFYVFQGISRDGLYLISFFYPVTTDKLPTSAEVPEEERQQVESDPQAYLAVKTNELNALAPSDWQPDLNTLDALIDSLKYKPPQTAQPDGAPLTNITWQWGELIQTDPLTRTAVTDPQNYTLIFFTDGSFSYQADCNSGSGNYVLEGNLLSLYPGPSTLVECGSDSLSNQYVTLLGNVESYAFESGSLVLGLRNDAGRMVFYSSGPSLELPPPGFGQPIATTLEPLNVRSGPSTDYPSYGVVPIGTTFEVTGISEDGGWWVVKIPTDIAPDGQGWISGSYVTTENTAGVPEVPDPPLEEVNLPPAESGQPTATALEPLNVRSGPGTQYPSYGVAPVGASAQVTGISEDGSWWVIVVPTTIAPDGQGWVNGSYVEVVDAQGVPVVPTPPLP